MVHRFQLQVLLLLLAAVLTSCESGEISQTGPKDTIAEIISRLQLCDTAAHPDKCVEAYRARIFNVKPAKDYSAFLYETIDGSAKGVPAVLIYVENKGELEVVQGIDGFFDTIPGSTTSGFYDIRIRQMVEKDSVVVWESNLYKWNGKGYENH